MIYFYLWVLFIISISLARADRRVRRESPSQKGLPTAAPPRRLLPPGRARGDAGHAPEEPVAAVEPDQGFEQPVAAGADDFSAFEDFK